MDPREDLGFLDVTLLHAKNGILVGPRPGFLGDALLQERIKFLQEELDELREYAGFRTLDALDRQVDALVDLVVVAKGTAVMMGLRWKKHWVEVSNANLAKVRGVGPRGNAVDLIKPPGWRAPDHRPILLATGFDGDVYETAEGRDHARDYR